MLTEHNKMYYFFILKQHRLMDSALEIYDNHCKFTTIIANLHQAKDKL